MGSGQVNEISLAWRREDWGLRFLSVEPQGLGAVTRRRLLGSSSVRVWVSTRTQGTLRDLWAVYSDAAEPLVPAVCDLSYFIT